MVSSLLPATDLILSCIVTLTLELKVGLALNEQLKLAKLLYLDGYVDRNGPDSIQKIVRKQDKAVCDGDLVWLLSQCQSSLWTQTSALVEVLQAPM